jgi:hypothetical protein
VPVEVNLAGVPAYTLYGDGTVIRTAAQPTGAAGTAPTLQAATTQPLETARLDEAAVQALLQEAKRAGLLAPGAIDYGDMGSVGVADMPTTTVSLAADDGKVERAAYALGAAADTGDGGTLSEAQRAARAALSGFVALTEAPLTGAKPYVPARLAVFIAPGLAQPDSADATPATLPLAADLDALTATGGGTAGFGCTVVEGDAVPTLLAAMRQASPSGLWRGPKGGRKVYRVVVRPLLPDEPGCPA